MRVLCKGEGILAVRPGGRHMSEHEPEGDDTLGRRQIDRFGPVSPEVLHVLLVQMQSSLTKLEATMEKGFSRLEQQFDQVEKRVAALEGFRERTQERDRALAKAEGQLQIRWPAVAALLTAVSIVVGVVVAVLSSAGGT